MPRTNSNTVLLAITVLLLLVVAYRQEQVRAHVDSVADGFGGSRLSVEVRMQSVSAKWLSGGIEIVVTTPRQPDQSDAEWAAAHRAAVNAMLEVFPKDP